MATTRISDLEKLFEEISSRVLVESAATSPIITSGLVKRNPQFMATLLQGGQVHSARFLNEYDGEDEVLTDDPSVESVTAKFTGGNQQYAALYRGKSWSTMDITRYIDNSDPARAIVDTLAPYLNRRHEAMFINTLSGVFADNVTNDSGDMVVDLGALSGSAANISFSAINAATRSLGDHSGRIKYMVVHSSVYSKLIDQEKTSYIQPSSVSLNLPGYGGQLTVIQSDLMPNNGIDYETWFIADDSVYYDSAILDKHGRVENGLEVWRNPASGNGGGEDKLYLRFGTVMHPVGFSYTGTYGSGPVNAGFKSKVSAIATNVATIGDTSGFTAGDSVTGYGFTEAGNNAVFTITSIGSATEMTITGLTNEAAATGSFRKVVAGALIEPASWDRAYPDRKQIGMVKLITDITK